MTIVRSRRLFGPVQITGTFQSQGAVPAGRTAVIRSFDLWNEDSGAHSVTFRLNATTGIGAFWRASVAGGASLHVEVHWYFNPGDEMFYAMAGATSALCSLSMFGALLDGEPS